MTGNGLGLILSLALVSCAGTAAAQTPDVKSELSSLLSGIHPYRDDNPVWNGEAGANPLPGAVTRMTGGERKAGDVIAEIEVWPRRTGRITSAVEIDHPVHGKLILAASSPVVASGKGMVLMGGGQPARKISSSIEWCTIPAADALPVCIERTAADKATYQEYHALSPRLRESRMTKRSWRGPAPVIVEDALELDTSTVRRMSIAEVTDEGVTLRIDTRDGDVVSPGSVSLPLTWGKGVTDKDRFPGLAFIVRRGTAVGQALIEVTSPPQ